MKKAIAEENDTIDALTSKIDAKNKEKEARRCPQRSQPAATYDKEAKESAIEKTTKNQDVKYKTTRSTKSHHVPSRFLQRGFCG